MVAPIIAGTVALGTVAWFLYVLWIGEAHGARPWRNQREHLMSLATEFGLTVDPSQEKATGELSGLPFAVGMRTVRGSKSKHVQLWASLDLPDCPPQVELRPEGYLSGVGRVFGAKELSLGDPDFDAAFVIRANSVEQVKNFLEPRTRAALLHCLPQVPHTFVKKGAVRTERLYATPNFMRRHFRPIFEGYQRFAEALQNQEAAPSPGEGGDVVLRRLRRFTRGTLLLWLIPCLLLWTSSLPSEGLAFKFLLTLGTVLTLAADSGNEVTRALLQGYYAFCASAVGGLLVLGLLDATELYRVRWLRLDEDDYLPFFLFTTVGAVLLWGVRNSLRALDRTRVVVRDSEGSSPGL